MWEIMQDHNSAPKTLISLRFEGELEANFQQQYRREFVRNARITLGLCFCIVVVLGSHTIFVPAGWVPVGWPHWYVAALLGLLVPSILSFFPRFHHLLPALIACALFGEGIGDLAVGSTVTAQSFQTNFFAHISLIVMITYTFVRLPFVYATGVCWGLIIGFAVVASVSHHLDYWIVTDEMRYLLAVNVFGMIASYTIERYIRQNYLLTRAVEREQERSDQLLLNILPAPIAQRLKSNPGTIADSFAEVSVLFADIVGFTPLSSLQSPEEIVHLLNLVFSRFDYLAGKHGLEKIKTIGDAYMVVGGLPEPRDDHAEAIAEIALDMQQEIALLNQQHGLSLGIRIGINTGPVVAGVIGQKKYIYDLWGDTVNIASRLESHGVNGSIQVSEATNTILRSRYTLEERGVIDLKGKGPTNAYFLRGRKSNAEQPIDNTRTNGPSHVSQPEQDSRR